VNILREINTKFKFSRIFEKRISALTFYKVYIILVSQNYRYFFIEINLKKKFNVSNISKIKKYETDNEKILKINMKRCFILRSCNSANDPAKVEHITQSVRSFTKNVKMAL